MGQVPQIADELVPDREIQPVGPVEVGDARRRGLGSQDRPRLTTGDEVDEDEHEGDDPDDHRHGLEEPPDEEAGHGPMLGINSTRDRPYSSSLTESADYFFT